MSYVNGTDKLGDLTTNDLNNFPTTVAAATSAGEYYHYSNASGAPLTISGGLFAGTVIPTARNIILVYSGDPDADDSGWIYHVGEASTTLTTNTPHPQNVPDTITAATIYGFERELTFTLPAGLADDNIVDIIHGINNVSGVINVELIEVGDPSGSLYEFEIRDIASGSPEIIPKVVSLNAARNYIKEIKIQYDGTAFRLYLKVVAAASGKSYRIEFNSEDVDLNPISVSNTKVNQSTFLSSIKADEKYPSNDFQNFVKAASGDASATLPAGLVLGQNAKEKFFPALDGRVTVISGYYSFDTQTSDDYAEIYMTRNGTAIPRSQVQNFNAQIVSNALSTFNDKTVVFVVDGIMRMNIRPLFYGREARFELVIDKRSPNKARIFAQTWYQAQAGVLPSYQWYECQIPAAYVPDQFKFTGHGGTTINWEIYKGR